MPTYTYTNSTSQSGYSVQQDVSVSNLDSVSSNITRITLSVTFSSSSWQGIECYVTDPDGGSHYIFNSGSLPFGSGSRTETLVVSSSNYPSSFDGTWEFHLSDMMMNSITVSSASVIAEVSGGASFKAYYISNINGVTGFNQ
jgi:hypothetical protein